VAVALLERERDLREHAPDKVLLDGRAVALGALDDGAQVAALAKLHHNVELRRRLVDDAVVVAHNVRVAELAEDVDLGRGGASARRGAARRARPRARLSPPARAHARPNARAPARTSETTSCFSFSRIVP